MPKTKKQDPVTLRKSFAAALRKVTQLAGLKDEPVVNFNNHVWSLNQVADAIEVGSHQGLAMYDKFKHGKITIKIKLS